MIVLRLRVWLARHLLTLAAWLLRGLSGPDGDGPPPTAGDAPQRVPNAMGT
jgi:hypothetical protein